MLDKGVTRAAANRKVRQEAQRDQLRNQGHLQHVIDIANKLCDLDTELDQTQIMRLKSTADIKLKLINKYIPDVKAVEVTGEGGEDIRVAAYEINFKS